MTTLNVIRKNRNQIRSGQFFLIDYWMLLATVGLLIIGMLMVYSTTFDIGLLWHGDASYFFNSQLQALGLGLVCSIIALRFY